jgi:hypothetical protein
VEGLADKADLDGLKRELEALLARQNQRFLDAGFAVVGYSIRWRAGSSPEVQLTELEPKDLAPAISPPTLVR